MLRSAVSFLRLLFLFTLVVFATALVPAAHAQTVQTITLDETALGRPFEGLGAVSGGGNTSRLLVDYPPAIRSQILDYLFKPDFGASLSELKVEVGGDVNSTEGSEPSYEHVRGVENFNGGFEWWLMHEAQVRNKSIVFDCLAWGAPGWVGNGNFWSTDMMNYYIDFIKGAKTYYDIDFASVGGCNERGYDLQWYEGFRKALDADGLKSVLLVGSDDWGPKWMNIANDAVRDSAADRAVNAIAGHVTWSENPGVASPAVLALNKPLWDSELHDYHSGGFEREIDLVDSFNINYINTKITKDMMWNLIWSYYPESSYPDVGILRANSPWSGHYEVIPLVWGFAHINQFVHPGWKFVDGGGCGLLQGGGTFTTLESPNSRDYSIIAETKGATDIQRLKFKLVNGFPGAKTLSVWRSLPDDLFDRDEVISSNGKEFVVDLQPNAIYSITSTFGQNKGTYPDPPAQRPLALPYSDNYQEYAVGLQPRYHYDYEGAFEIANKTVGKGTCLRQNAIKSNNSWGGAFLPLTFLGDASWTDYTVSVNAYVEQAGAVSLHGRIDTIPGNNSVDPPGYTFRVQDTGAWTLECFSKVLAQGTCIFSPNAWHTLSLSFKGAHIIASVDGAPVETTDDNTYASGLVGLGTGWNFAQFSDLKVVPNP